MNFLICIVVVPFDYIGMVETWLYDVSKMTLLFKFYMLIILNLLLSWC